MSDLEIALIRGVQAVITDPLPGAPAVSSSGVLGSSVVRGWLR